MKLKNITILSVALFALSACGERHSPDELTVLKYKPLVIPQKFELVEPISGKKSLGHVEPRELIASQTLAYGGSNDNDILKKFRISNTEDSIRDNLKKSDYNILVDVEAEQKRIKDNLAQGKSVTDGKTPTIDTKYTTTGVEELFDD